MLDFVSKYSILYINTCFFLYIYFNINTTFCLSCIFVFFRAFSHSCFSVHSQDWKSDFKHYMASVGGWPILEGPVWKEVPWWQLASKTVSNVIISVVTDTLLEPGETEQIESYTGESPLITDSPPNSSAQSKKQ